MTTPTTITLDDSTRQALAEQQRALYWQLHNEYTVRFHGRDGHMPSQPPTPPADAQPSKRKEAKQ